MEGKDARPDALGLNFERGQGEITEEEALLEEVLAGEGKFPAFVAVADDAPEVAVGNRIGRDGAFLLLGEVCCQAVCDRVPGADGELPGDATVRIYDADLLEAPCEQFQADRVEPGVAGQAGSLQPMYLERSKRESGKLLRRWNLVVLERVLNRTWAEVA